MGSISFGGIASGIDTNSIVSKIVALEKTQATKLETRQAGMQKRISVLADLSTKLKALDTAAKAVDTSGELRARTVTTKGSELAATATATSQPGSWTVKVNQLARAEADRSRPLTSRAAGVLGTGSVSIGVGAGTPVMVTYGATDSLDAIATKINDTVTGVTASVVDAGNGEFRLVVSSETTGTANGLTISETGDGLGMTEAVGARDAQVEIAGTTITRSSNTIDDVIPGVTLALSQVTAAGSDGATVSVNEDTAARRTAVQGLLDAHNAVAKVLATQLTYNGTVKGEDTLFGDSTLQALQRQLGGTWTSAFTSGASQVTARDLGITLQTDGTLKLDVTKFDAAIAASPDKLEHLLTGDDGLSSKLHGMVDAMTQSSTGMLSAKSATLTKRIKSFDDQISRIETSAEALGDRMRRQFSKLEEAMSAMQSNLSYLSSLLNSG